MSIIESAISWMENTARDDSHGYSQTTRWGPDYDCSSAVITAWQQAGVPVKDKGATYTGNMYNIFTKSGFVDVTPTVKLATGDGLERGDVLLNDRHHTAMYCGNHMEVEASINEFGRATGGVPGDQTGKEFLIRPYRNYPWDHVLRYNTPLIKNDPPYIATSAVFKRDDAKYGISYNVVVNPLSMRKDGTTSAEEIKQLHIGDKVTWFGYYKADILNRLWLYVTDGTDTGYVCYGERGKDYLEVIV